MTNGVTVITLSDAVADAVVDATVGQLSLRAVRREMRGRGIKRQHSSNAKMETLLSHAYLLVE